VDEDERNELLEPFGVPKNVRARLERIPEERLQRLEKTAGGTCVGVDMCLDWSRVLVVARSHPDAEEMELAREGAARAVVFEVRLNCLTSDDRSAVPPDVQDGRHGLPSDEIDGEDAHGIAVGHGQRSI